MQIEAYFAAIFGAGAVFLAGYFAGRLKTQKELDVVDGWVDECNFWRTEAFPVIRKLAEQGYGEVDDE